MYKRQTFWIASPTGNPVTAMLRPIQGPATSANPPTTRPTARHRAAGNRRATPQIATPTRMPAEYSQRKRAPQRAPRMPSAAAAFLNPSADSTRHHAWKVPSARTIMSAVPFTATTCCPVSYTHLDVYKRQEYVRVVSDSRLEGYRHVPALLLHGDRRIHGSQSRTQPQGCTRKDNSRYPHLGIRIMTAKLAIC